MAYCYGDLKVRGSTTIIGTITAGGTGPSAQVVGYENSSTYYYVPMPSDKDTTLDELKELGKELKSLVERERSKNMKTFVYTLTRMKKDKEGVWRNDKILTPNPMVILARDKQHALLVIGHTLNTIGVGPEEVSVTLNEQ